MITEYLCNITGFYHKCKIRTCFLLTYTVLTHILTLMPMPVLFHQHLVLLCSWLYTGLGLGLGLILLLSYTVSLTSLKMMRVGDDDQHCSSSSSSSSTAVYPSLSWQRVATVGGNTFVFSPTRSCSSALTACFRPNIASSVCNHLRPCGGPWWSKQGGLNATTVARVNPAVYSKELAGTQFIYLTRPQSARVFLRRSFCL